MNALKEKVLVMKFGGTSLGTFAAMSQAVENVKQAHDRWAHVVVVVSALSWVTDMLI